ncbi:MAG: leucine-rich repeat domain-containing protein [Alistipes putredinis]|nr:MAG: leucine-rich repeat domain-containing protein [Alistipes putredinis]
MYTGTFTNCLSLFNVTIEEGVEMIDADAFRFAEKILTLTLPSSIKIIYNWALPSCINNLYVKATTPPVYREKSVAHGSIYDYGTLLKNFDKNNLKIYIPRGTLELYKSSAGWKYYKDYFC